MKIMTFLWAGLVALSMGAFLVSAPQAIYADETHGDTHFIRPERNGAHHDDDSTTNHRDGDNHGTDIGTNRVHHDNDTIEAQHHDFTTDRRPRYDGGSPGDRDERYEHRDYKKDNVLIFTWGTNDYRYDRLGTVWYETEGPYHGVWTRRGTSNVFDAVWTYGARRVTAVLTIYLDGDRVTVYRHNAGDGYDYTYTGILFGNETRVRGSVSGGPIVWDATITGYRM